MPLRRSSAPPPGPPPVLSCCISRFLRVRSPLPRPRPLPPPSALLTAVPPLPSASHATLFLVWSSIHPSPHVHSSQYTSIRIWLVHFCVSSRLAFFLNFSVPLQRQRILSCCKTVYCEYICEIHDYLFNAYYLFNEEQPLS